MTKEVILKIMAKKPPEEFEGVVKDPRDMLKGIIEQQPERFEGLDMLEDRFDRWCHSLDNFF